jgi:2-dehydro-3-deoxyphosphogluconate aldolase/(4S)-4-hydroxy-2-oxoglutarate aldolase
MLKALSGPFPEVSFCPTGGITAQNAREFLALSQVKVCGGTWLTPQDAIQARDWARITRLARETAALR